MYTIDELRTTLDDLSEGALYALNHVTKKQGWKPHICVSPDTTKPGYTLFCFYATDATGQTCYFDYLSTPQDVERDTQINAMMTQRDTRQREARLRLDPNRN